MQIQKNYALSQRNKLKSIKINVIRKEIRQTIIIALKEITIKNISAKRNKRAIIQKSIRVKSGKCVKQDKIK